MKTLNIALIRGAFLNPWEMQNYVPLKRRFNLVAFSSLRSLMPYKDPLRESPSATPGVDLSLPLIKLSSPMDLPNFPYKMPILNRLFVDAHWLFGLEEKLKGFDIAHVAETYYAYTHQALEAKKKGLVKKVISTCWEIIPHNNEGIWGRKKWKMQALKEIDHFICPTELAKRCLIKEGCRPNKISVIKMGVDVKKVRPCVAARSDLKQKINILFVGRLEKEKGMWELLEAFKVLANSSDPARNHPGGVPQAQHHPRGGGIAGSSLGKLTPWRGLSLIMIGEGSQKKEIKKWCITNKLTDKILLKGKVDYRQIWEEYKKADIFVLSSKPTKTWQEQYGMVLVEAMAAGLPIVASKTGAIPEVLGKAGILVKPGDVVQLTKALAYLINNPKKRVELGKRARKRAEKFFDRKKIAEEIEKIYRLQGPTLRRCKVGP